MADDFKDFKDQVRRGFNNCLNDIESLKEENIVLKNKNNDLNLQISDLKTEIKAINIALNYIKEFSIQNQIKVQKEEVEPEKLVNKITMPNIITSNTSNQDPYSALLAFKAKSNKRDVLKQKMVTMITQTGINLAELKFLFVDHYKYCSKATFYNYLKELELERALKIERENSRNMVFLYNSLEREI